MSDNVSRGLSFIWNAALVFVNSEELTRNGRVDFYNIIIELKDHINLSEVGMGVH